MKLKDRRRWLTTGVLSAILLALSGCNTLGGNVADLGLAGAGGVAGYHLSDGKIGGAAAGAAVGYVGSRLAQSEMQRREVEAEKRGFDRAMNQAVKQHYWSIQAQQRSAAPAAEADAALTPVVIPETKIDGVIYNRRVEYIRVQP